MNGTCYIVGSGDFTPKGLNKQPGDLVIAADGGYLYLSRLGLAPDLLAGDFDSLGYVPDGVPLLRFPREKDDTDMGISLRYGREHGCRRFRIYGGSGSRPDHFLANLQMLAGAARDGLDVALICPGFEVLALHNAAVTLSRPSGTVFSVFSSGGTAAGVSIENAKYSIHDAALADGFPLGVSNEFTGGDAAISVKDGTLWIFVYDGVNNL